MHLPGQRRCDHTLIAQGNPGHLEAILGACLLFLQTNKDQASEWISLRHLIPDGFLVKTGSKKSRQSMGWKKKAANSSQMLAVTTKLH